MNHDLASLLNELTGSMHTDQEKTRRDVLRVRAELLSRGFFCVTTYTGINAYIEVYMSPKFGTRLLHILPEDSGYELFKPVTESPAVEAVVANL